MSPLYYHPSKLYIPDKLFLQQLELRDIDEVFLINHSWRQSMAAHLFSISNCQGVITNKYYKAGFRVDNYGYHPSLSIHFPERKWKQLLWWVWDDEFAALALPALQAIPLSAAWWCFVHVETAPTFPNATCRYMLTIDIKPDANLFYAANTT